MATAAACAASVPAPELSEHDENQQQSGPAACSIKPAAPPPALAADATGPDDPAAEVVQPPAPAADVSAADSMHQAGATLPAGTAPAATQHSPQPATTDADSCSGETAATEVQQSDDERSSPADSAPASCLEACAAVAADNSVMPSCAGQPPEGSNGLYQAQPAVGADGAHGFAAEEAGSNPVREVSDPAADDADAAAAGSPAGQLDALRSPMHAGATSEEINGDALDGAHLPLQLPAGSGDETVNITSASPCDHSPGPEVDAASSEGYRLYPDSDDGEAQRQLCEAFENTPICSGTVVMKGTGMPT